MASRDSAVSLAFQLVYERVAGKTNWYDPGFYPVSERMITSFDASYSDVLLVDVGGGRGHDVAAFAT